jgi:hypothetical protein
VTAAAGVGAPATVRLAEVLAALSLASDAGNGFPLEKSLRNAVIAVRLGGRPGLTPGMLSDVYYVALLRSIGCTAYAHETAAWLGGEDGARAEVARRRGGHFVDTPGTSRRTPRALV